MKVQIIDAEEARQYQRPRKAPATRMIEQLPEGHFTTRDMATRFEVNIETIRRLARAKDEKGNKKFTAPSKAARNGEQIIWVYTPEDVNELAEYFGDRRKPPARGRKSK